MLERGNAINKIKRAVREWHMNSVVMKKRKYGIPEKSWFRPRNHMLSNVQADYLTGVISRGSDIPFHRLHDVSHPAADLHNPTHPPSGVRRE